MAAGEEKGSENADADEMETRKAASSASSRRLSFARRLSSYR